jgi:hypothetical protein
VDREEFEGFFAHLPILHLLVHLELDCFGFLWFKEREEDEDLQLGRFDDLPLQREKKTKSSRKKQKQGFEILGF